MLAYVHFAGWLSLLIAAFSAGRPNASHPIGCSTEKPFMRSLTRDHVADRVVAHVAHVDVARRVREHLEDVLLRLAGVLGGAIGAVALPPRLPFGSMSLRLVSQFTHGVGLLRRARPRSNAASSDSSRAGPGVKRETPVTYYQRRVTGRLNGRAVWKTPAGEASGRSCSDGGA